jgi:integrase
VKGHIRERSPGHWAIVIDIRDPTGSRKRRWHSFAGTKRQAQTECARLISEIKGGTYIDPSKVTVAEYLDRWLAHVATQISAGSHKTYSTMVRAYIRPVIGAMQLAKLRPADIAHLYALTLGGAAPLRLRHGLAPRSVALVHRVLSQALRQAVQWQLLSVNPATAVKAPKIERRHMDVLDPAATLALVDAARGTDLFMPVLLAAMTGLRRGEIAALRWRSVNLDIGQLSVVANVEQVGYRTREKPPKSGRGRSVALPALVVNELRRHRMHQAEHLLRLGIRQDEATHVCLRAGGTPWPPSGLTTTFGSLLGASGLPRVRFHDLRHSHATHLLAANVHPKVVQERLGHASIAMTLDLYSHTVKGMQEEAAASVDTIMRAAMKKKGSKAVANGRKTVMDQ